jgi:hypothetical protein
LAVQQHAKPFLQNVQVDLLGLLVQVMALVVYQRILLPEESICLLAVGAATRKRHHRGIDT